MLVTLTAILFGLGLFSLGTSGFSMGRKSPTPQKLCPLRLADPLKTLKRRSQVVTKLGNFSPISTALDPPSSSTSFWIILQALLPTCLGDPNYLPIYQRRVSREQLNTAHRLLLQWVLDFEIIYCHQDQNRPHFVWQYVRSLTYLARETHRLGLLSLSSQWTMEHVIGYLGSLLRQPSNPFRNLMAQTKRVVTANGLSSMWPDFEPEKENPRGSIELGDGYLLLGPKDTTL